MGKLQPLTFINIPTSVGDLIWTRWRTYIDSLVSFMLLLMNGAQLHLENPRASATLDLAVELQGSHSVCWISRCTRLAQMQIPLGMWTLEVMHPLLWGIIVCSLFCWSCGGDTSRCLYLTCVYITGSTTVGHSICHL